MFEYLRGVITAITPAYIVVDVGGVGYQVFSPTPFAYHEGQKAKVYVVQNFSDNNGFTLYGFPNARSKGLFLKLLSVSGIGPKSALAIMAAEDSDSLAEAIEQGQVKYLTRFPGVGKKTASQIVLDLKGKLGDYVQRLDAKPKTSSEQNLTPALHDALLALLALGYTQKEVDRITPKLEKADLPSADQYIKKGLALMLHR